MRHTPEQLKSIAQEAKKSLNQVRQKFLKEHGVEDKKEKSRESSQQEANPKKS